MQYQENKDAYGSGIHGQSSTRIAKLCITTRGGNCIMYILRNFMLIIFLCTTVLISGCVTMTEPVSMGEGRYLITLNARGGFESDGSLLSKSIEKANQF